MAIEDYYPCNYCGNGVFYDAGIYDNDDYSATVASHRVVALCKTCAKTHEIAIKRKKE